MSDELKNNLSDYHDYVFKDGKLVGKFDEMYKYSSEIPWHQDKTAYAVFSDIDIVILKQYKYDSILEVGCGLGYFLNRLFREISSNGGGRPLVTGIDVSQTSVEKASRQFPEITFVVGDLTKENPFINGKSNIEVFDLVVVKEVFWYVTHFLQQFLNNVMKLVEKGGFLYISQSFPESDNWVGQDVIDSPERLQKILSDYLKPITMCYEKEYYGSRGNYLHYLGKKL